MLTEKDYCDYETCVALRELGYNAPQRLIPDYFGVFEEPQYDEKIHLYDAQKWLREEKKLFVEITIFEYTYAYRILDTQNVYYDNEHVVRREGRLVGSYEETLSEGIKEAVKILKK